MSVRAKPASTGHRHAVRSLGSEDECITYSDLLSVRDVGPLPVATLRGPPAPLQVSALHGQQANRRRVRRYAPTHGLLHRPAAGDLSSLHQSVGLFLTARRNPLSILLPSSLFLSLEEICSHVGYWWYTSVCGREQSTGTHTARKGGS